MEISIETAINTEKVIDLNTKILSLLEEDKDAKSTFMRIRDEVREIKNTTLEILKVNLLSFIPLLI
jgi:hypothetical protein